MTPTNRTLEALSAFGGVVDIVERRITPTLTKDFAGIADLIYIDSDGVTLIQATTAPNISARLKKIGNNPLTEKLKGWGVKIECWGWRKVKGKWEARIVDV